MFSISNFFFLIFLNLGLVSSIFVVLSVNPIHSVLFLVIAFCNVAGLLILLGASFLGILFIIVYVGAIAVLFLFVIMMLDIKNFKFSLEVSWAFYLSYFLFFLYFIFLLPILKGVFSYFYFYVDLFCVNFCDFFFLNFYLSYNLYAFSNIEVIGSVIYSYFFILIIFASVILLLAMVCSIFLTLRKVVSVRTQQVSSQVYNLYDLSVISYSSFSR